MSGRHGYGYGREKNRPQTLSEQVGDCIDDLLCCLCCGICAGVQECCGKICSHCNPCVCIFLPLLGIIKGVICFPVVLLIMVFGTLVTSFLHLLPNLGTCYSAICRTNQLGPTVKVFSFLLAVIPIVLWPVVCLLGGLWLSITLGLFGPLFSQEWDPTVIQRKCSEDNDECCGGVPCSGISESIAKAGTAIQDLWNWHWVTWFQEVEHWATKPEPPGGPFEIHLIGLIIGLVMSVLGLALAPVLFLLTVLVKFPLIVWHYWVLLWDQTRRCLSDCNCIATGWWICGIPFFAFSFVLVPFGVLGYAIGAVFKGLVQGFYTPFSLIIIDHQIWKGTASVYLLWVAFDRELNHAVWQEDDPSCLPVCDCCPKDLERGPAKVAVQSSRHNYPAGFEAPDPSQRYQPAQPSRDAMADPNAARNQPDRGSGAMGVARAAVGAVRSAVGEARGLAQGRAASDAQEPPPAYVEPGTLFHRIETESIWQMFFASAGLRGKAAMDRGWLSRQDVQTNERWLFVGVSSSTVLGAIQRSVQMHVDGFLLPSQQIVTEDSRPRNPFADGVYDRMMVIRFHLESLNLQGDEWLALERYLVLASRHDYKLSPQDARIKDIGNMIIELGEDITRTPSFHRRFQQVHLMLARHQPAQVQAQAAPAIAQVAPAAPPRPSRNSAAEEEQSLGERAGTVAISAANKLAGFVRGWGKK